MKHMAALTAVLAAAAMGSAQAQPASPSYSLALSARSVHHGEAVPLSAIGDEDEALAKLDPRPGRNIAYVDDEVRLSLATGAWTWSLLARNSAVLVTNQATLELVQQISNDVTPTADRQWQAQIRYESFQGGGLELGYRFAPAAQWQAGLATQVLQLSHWRQRTLNGQVNFAAASETYAFDLKSTQTDDRLRFPFQGPQDDTGAGLLLAGDLGWRGDAWAASVSLRDFGWLRWNNLPQQYATLSTQTQSYYADGFVIYKPLIEGRNSQQGYTHQLHGWWTARASWRAAGVGEIELSSDWVHDFGALPGLAWRQRLGEVDLGLQWRFHERRATVALGWRGLQLRVGADRLDSQQQRSRELALSGAWSF